MTTVMLCYMTCYDCGLLSAWASFPVVWCHIFIALVAAQRGTDGPFVTWGCAGPESPNPPGGTSCWWSGPGGKNQSKGLLLFGDLQSSPLGYVKILGNQMKPAWNPNKYLCISLQHELPIFFVCFQFLSHPQGFMPNFAWGSPISSPDISTIQSITLSSV